MKQKNAIGPMNIWKSENFYCNAATFICILCEYQTHIYSNIEWLKTTIKKDCEKCKKFNKNHFDEPVIYRDDLGNSGHDIPLHIQIASLPINKQNCLDCINQNEIHWTVFLLNCKHCNTDTMEFSEYTVGKNIALFNEWCQDWQNPPILKLTGSIKMVQVFSLSVA